MIEALNAENERLSHTVVKQAESVRELEEIKEQNRVLMMEVEELEEANKRKKDEIQ